MSSPAASPSMNRGDALRTVIGYAPDLGVHEALKRFGAGLTEGDRDAISALSSDELASLRAASSKLAATDLFANNNNNNNNEEQ